MRINSLFSNLSSQNLYELTVLMNDYKLQIEELTMRIADLTQQITDLKPDYEKNSKLFHNKKDAVNITENLISQFSLSNFQKTKGKLLSGGERQLIALARALYKNSTILILDEATSALDSDSEKNIQKALNNLMAGRTTFIITHRLSTIEKADMIMVLEDGKISDSGTHDQLLANNSIYNQLLSGYSEPNESESIL